MKTYTILCQPAGVICQAVDDAAGPKKNGHVSQQLAGIFAIGDTSKESLALASAVVNHYYDVPESGPGGAGEADRQAEPFLHAFLLHHRMDPGARYIITSDNIDAWLRGSK